MVGTTGPRLFAAAAPHVDAWNVWYSQYGNTPSGYAELSSRFPGSFDRSACVLVAVDGGGGERPLDPGAPPVGIDALPRHLEELEAAGADEAILVLDPITERSVMAVGVALSPA
jgi:hypothetical protein